MATKNFTITYTAGAGLKLAVFRLSDGYVLDFADNAFKSTVGGATTPYSSGTELTAPGGASFSVYKVALDLSHVNSSGTAADFLIDWYTDTSLTNCVSVTELISVVSSDLETTGGGGGGLDAAGVRDAVGLASANLDTQLAALAGYIDTEVAAIKAKTDLIGTSSLIADAGITSAKFAAGAIDAAAIATDAFGSLELAAGAATEIATAVSSTLGLGGTVAELTGPVDTANATLNQLVMGLAMQILNRADSDAEGNITVYNAADSAVWTQAATTDGATISRAKGVSP